MLNYDICFLLGLFLTSVEDADPGTVICTVLTLWQSIYQSRQFPTTQQKMQLHYFRQRWIVLTLSSLGRIAFMIRELRATYPHPLLLCR